MKVIDQPEQQTLPATALEEGAKAKIKHTGQIVELKSVSAHGISVVSFRTGGDYFISNKFLEPLHTLH